VILMPSGWSSLSEAPIGACWNGQILCIYSGKCDLLYGEIPDIF
jgi:hypothetical protein